MDRLLVIAPHLLPFSFGASEREPNIFAFRAPFEETGEEEIERLCLHARGTGEVNQEKEIKIIKRALRKIYESAKHWIETGKEYPPTYFLRFLCLECGQRRNYTLLPVGEVPDGITPEELKWLFKQEAMSKCAEIILSGCDRCQSQRFVPVACIFVSEAWAVSETSLDSETISEDRAQISPSEHPKRKELLILHATTAFDKAFLCFAPIDGRKVGELEIMEGKPSQMRSRMALPLPSLISGEQEPPPDYIL
jgi:hypothetical protein